MKSRYAPHDPCWIELHGKDGLHEGRVVLSFHLDTDFPAFYVVKVLDPAHITLEVRDATLMSTAADELPPISLNKYRASWQIEPERFYDGVQ